MPHCQVVYSSLRLWAVYDLTTYMKRGLWMLGNRKIEFQRHDKIYPRKRGLFTQQPKWSLIV